MVIVNIINSILQAMVDDPDCELKSWQYNDLGTANLRLDNKKPSPTAVFLQVSDWSLTHNAVNVRETADVNISFLEKEGKLDAGGLEQDEIIDRMKSIAINFLQRLGNVKKLQIVNPDDDIKIKSVYLRSDSNRSGVNLQMTIRERQGECIEGEYNPVFTVTENGTYDVAGYTQVTVNIECPEPPVPPVPVVSDYLCFTANVPDSTIGIYNINNSPVLYYSSDCIYWTRWDYSDITLRNAGDKVYFYGYNPNGVNKTQLEDKYSRFTMTGSISASGDLTTLINQAGGVDDLSGIDGFSYLFRYCSALTTPPELPSTTLGDSCYSGLFGDCTSLTTAPELPATTLATGCYSYMFSGCTSLTTAPVLPAATLVSTCYQGMFNGCSSLNWIKVGTTNWNTLRALDWVKDVAPTGTFHKLSTLTNIPINSKNGVPIGWTVVNDDDPPVPPTPTEPDYVSFTAEQAGATIGMVNTNNSPVLYWSTDKENWTQWDYSNITLANAGDKIYFYGNNPNGVSGAINSSSFAITGNVAVSGDITTLITREGTNTVPAYCFNALFQNCDITSAPELPATTLGDGCYLSMFKGCTSLTTAPALPATTLATNCYWGMFNGCISLTTAPALPATTLADGCYYGMFVLCSSLATAPELPATTLVQNCYGSMFNGCPSLQNVTCLATDVSATDCTWEWLNGVSETGTFTKSADMNDWTTGTSGIPSGWTVNNR